MTIDRTPKPCLHKVASHEHGTYRCYTLDGCRCLPCAYAASEYNRQLSRRNAYGRSNLVDAEPVRQHVAALMTAGIGLKRIVKVSGVPQGVLWKLMYGKKRTGGDAAPSRRVMKSTAERLLALDPADRALAAAGAKVPGIGTARRLQALACLGWSVGRVATETRLDRQPLDQALNGGEVTARTARAVAEAYEHLWDRPAPAGDQRERISVSRTLRRAKASGWAPPAAWDENIDDPTATPALGGDEDVVDQVDELAVDAVADGHSMPLSGLTLLAALDRLTEAGHPVAVIADRLRIPEHQVWRLRGRNTVPPRLRRRGAA